MLTQEKTTKHDNDKLKKKSLFTLCYSTSVCPVCVLGDTSGGLQYILNCHTAAPVNTMGLMAHRQPVSAHPTLFIYLIVA